MAAFPFLLYWGLVHFPPRLVAALLLVPMATRFFLSRYRGVLTRFDLVLLLLLAVLMVAVSLLDSEPLLLFYPVLVSAVLLFSFSRSLFRPPTVIERIARVRDPDLSPRGVLYTRRVTQVWSGFFAFNLLVAVATALGPSRKAWLLYNGFLSYLIIGVLFAGEWAVRVRFQRKEAAK